MRGKKPTDVFLTENKTLTPEGVTCIVSTDTSSVNSNSVARAGDANNRGAGSLTTNG